MAATTTYTVDPNIDPRYAAVVAGIQAQEKAARNQADFVRKQAEADLAYRLGQIDMQAPGERRRLDANQLARGVYRSGETERRRGELSADVMDRQERARYAAMTAQSGAFTTLAQQLADLASRRAAEEGDSRRRVMDYQERLRQQARAEEEARKRIAAVTPTTTAPAPAAGGGGGGGGASGGGGGGGGAPRSTGGGTPTYNSPAEYQRAVEAYMAAVARNQAAAAKAAAPPRPSRPTTNKIQGVAGRYYT